MSERPRFSTDREVLEREVRLEYLRARGPGGQHANTTETGVRLVHPPSGITVMAAERRSQGQNRDLAFERLIQKLTVLNRPRRKRVATKPTRSSVRRRLEEKGRRSNTKRDRRGGGEG
ncbi:MAG: peptide chain release factor-like protein [Planctomycetaceae bacterium]|nr:peptide chain release factor-like protein [Planctomycetaceae bacterium]